MAYEINININGDIENVEDSGVAGTGGSGTSGTSASISDTRKNIKALGKYVVGQTVTPIITNAKTAVSQQVGIATGNKELQERVNFGMQMLETGSTLYSTAQAGAVIATSFGISGKLGLGVGLLLGVAGIGISLAFNQQQINLQKRMESYQIRQVRDRQGVAYNRSRS